MLIYLSNWLFFFYFHFICHGGPNLNASVNSTWQSLWVITDYDPNMGNSKTFGFFHEVTLLQGTHSSNFLEAITLLNSPSRAPHCFDWPTTLAYFYLRVKTNHSAKEVEHTRLAFNRVLVLSWVSIRWRLKRFLCLLSHSSLSCQLTLCGFQSSPWNHLAWHKRRTMNFTILDPKTSSYEFLFYSGKTGWKVILV